jgi:hypothetical protein
METPSTEKARTLAEQHGWSLAHAEGYVDGETSRLSGQAPSQYALVGFDEYSLGFRAGYFERRNLTSMPMQKPYWRYTKANGWVVRDPNSHAVHCPQCDSRTYRISRRFIDRVISVILPVRRYQCEEHGCRWQGNLPLNPDSKMARIAAGMNRPFRFRARRRLAAEEHEG